MKQGTAKRNRGTGVVNWTHVAKMFSTHLEHIMRVRKDQKKLIGLRNRLIARK